MDYGEILTKAWKTIWKFKVLWIFGILASCGQGGGSGGGGNVQYQMPSSSLPPEIQRLFMAPEYFFREYWWTLVLMCGLICVLVLLSIFLGTIGKIGLVKGTVKADGGAEHLGFGEIWSASLPYFWRVFLLNLLVGLVIFAAVFLFAMIAMMLTVVTLGIALICLIPLFCLIIPVMWAVSVVIEQATVAVVVEDLNVLEGLNRGWNVVKTNWQSMLIMGIVLIFGMAVIGLIIALPVFMVMFGAIIPMTVGGINAFRNGMIFMMVCMCAYMPILILLSGILNAYYHTAWTLTFLRVTGQKPSDRVDVLDIPDSPLPDSPAIEPLNG